MHGHLFTIIIESGCRKWIPSFFKRPVVTVYNHPEESWNHVNQDANQKEDETNKQAGEE